MDFRHSALASAGRAALAILTIGLALGPLISKTMAQPNSPAPGSGGADAVFDAPGMPGVRMMAPIPDSVAPNPIAKPSPAASANTRITLKQVLAAAARDWNSARLLAAQAGNPTLRLIAEWRYLLEESGGANFETIDAFIKEHPNWPRRDALLIRAEKAMPDDYAPDKVIAWYGNRAPLSGVGTLRLGSALIETGKRAEGIAQIRKGWIQFVFPPNDENQIVRTHSNILGPEEQKTRLLRLLANDDIVSARRQLRRVDAQTQRLGNAILRVKESPAAANTVLASLPESTRNEPELLFEASRALRRRNQDEAAWALMDKAPTNKADLVAAERWSVERQIMARDALKSGMNELAYRFASAPSLDADSGGVFMDAEFLAGWIALRYLKKPDLAYHHFDRLAKGVVNPISVARAHYWLGRAADVMNRRDEAIAEYRRAAEFPTTFYGQVALSAGENNARLRLKSAATDISPADSSKFEADDRVQAIKLHSEIGDRTGVRQFAFAIASDPPEPKKLQLLAQLMTATGDQAMSVRVAKNASFGGVYLTPYLHPVPALPKFSSDAPETALVLGVTRQESEFDSGAVSSAGARGLMQLMPASAKRAATLGKLSYRPKDLTNPTYNMQLGTALVADYLDVWGGSYILGIASYNAGPANVRRWVQTYGDPRDAGVDPIDWIESIPFPETRNYVQRVLENLEVYRNRLSNSDQTVLILADLYRPNGVEAASALRARSALDVTIPAPK